MIGKLRVLAVAGAVVVFILPWVELRFSGNPVIRQSGLEIATGGSHLAPGMNERLEKDAKARSNPEELAFGKDGNIPMSFLIGVAFLLTVASLIAAVADTNESKPKAGLLSGLFALVAFILFACQLAISVPMEQKIRESVQTIKSKVETAESHEEKVFHQMAAAFISDMFKVTKLPTIYSELAFLIVPILLIMVSLQRMQRPAGWNGHETRAGLEASPQLTSE